jgi:hypothetical protein
MSTEAVAGAHQDEDPDVLVSDTVLGRIRALSASERVPVARAILRIRGDGGEPISLAVPGDPPGTQYQALVPDSEKAPVIIYRRSLPGEKGRWLVTALMDQDAYREYSHGLAKNAVVQGVATIVAAATVTATAKVLPPQVSVENAEK